MSDLMDKDRTEARERAYPNQMGATLGAFASAYIEQAGIARDKALARTIDMLGRPNVKAVSRVSMMDGTDLMVGLSIPAVTMVNLEPNEPTSGKISGSMRVQETNKAKSNDKTGVKWGAQGGIGAGLWHVDTSISVSNSHTEDRARDTDFSARVEWEVNFGPGKTPEGVALIQSGLNQAIAMAMQGNLMLIQRKVDAIKEDPDALEKLEADPEESPDDAPATPAQADKEQIDDSEDPPDKEKIDKDEDEEDKS